MLSALRTRYDSLEGRRWELLDDLETLRGTQLSFCPTPSAWSVLEVVHHLVLVEQGILWAIQQPPGQAPRRKSLRHRLGYAAVWLVFKLGLRVKVPTTRVRPQPGVPLSQLKEEWAVARTSLEAFLNATTEGTLEATTFRHPICGPMNVEETLWFLLRHFDHHLRQINRIRRSDAFPHNTPSLDS